MRNRLGRKKHLIRPCLCMLLTALLLPGAAFAARAESVSDALPASSASYELAENDRLSFEYPSGWSSWDAEGTLFASRDGSETEPVFFVRPCDSSLSAGEYLVERKNTYEQTYRERMSKPPQIVTIDLGGGRSPAGFTAQSSSSDGSRTLATVEVVEEIGGQKYHSYCCYVTYSNDEQQPADDTTYADFIHALQTLQIK